MPVLDYKIKFTYWSLKVYYVLWMSYSFGKRWGFHVFWGGSRAKQCLVEQSQWDGHFHLLVVLDFHRSSLRGTTKIVKTMVLISNENDQYSASAALPWCADLVKDMIPADIYRKNWLAAECKPPHVDKVHYQASQSLANSQNATCREDYMGMATPASSLKSKFSAILICLSIVWYVFIRGICLILFNSDPSSW